MKTKKEYSERKLIKALKNNMEKAKNYLNDDEKMEKLFRDFEEKLALILGTEGDGLTEKTIRMSDIPVIIPMGHGVDSLNVAAASAVAFWELRKR